MVESTSCRSEQSVEERDTWRADWNTAPPTAPRSSTSMSFHSFTIYLFRWQFVAKLIWFFWSKKTKTNKQTDKTTLIKYNLQIFPLNGMKHNKPSFSLMLPWERWPVCHCFVNVRHGCCIFFVIFCLPLHPIIIFHFHSNWIRYMNYVSHFCWCLNVRFYNSRGDESTTIVKAKHEIKFLY